MKKNKTIIIRLEQDLHKFIRHQAIDAGMSMNQLILFLMNNYRKKVEKN